MLFSCLLLLCLAKIKFIKASLDREHYMGVVLYPSLNASVRETIVLATCFPSLWNKKAVMEAEECFTKT